MLKPSGRKTIDQTCLKKHANLANEQVDDYVDKIRKEVHFIVKKLLVSKLQWVSHYRRKVAPEIFQQETDKTFEDHFITR